MLLVASTGAAGVASTALAFTDEIRSSYEAVERTGRVVAALVICINEYAMVYRGEVRDPRLTDRLATGQR